MILLFVWLAVAAGLGYEITSHGFWRDGLAACAVASWILWVAAGLVAMPVLGKRRRARERREMLKSILAEQQKTAGVK